METTLYTQKVRQNGERYRTTINDLFVPELKAIDTDDLWFQQDDAICLAANETISLLKEPFGERIISCCGLGACPSRSCDFTPLIK